MLAVDEHTSGQLTPNGSHLVGNGPEDGVQVQGHAAFKGKLGFGTKAVHAGQDPKQWSHRAVIPPIVLSTTFEQLAPAKPIQYEYGRSGNPTRNCLELALAELEGGKHGLAFSSGLGATTTIAFLLSSGDHLICGDDVYGGTGRLFRSYATLHNIEVSFVDATSTDKIRAAVKPNTRMIWMESPTNPTMKLCDIAAIADIVADVRASNGQQIIYVVDNTFMSPYFQKPLQLGADIVLHSISKYINGHSDVIMGGAVLNDDVLATKLRFCQNAFGSVPSPFDCYLVNRGLKTLHLRMEAHQKNGLAVAQYLEDHPMVSKVIHPGLKSHPQHELALRQNSGFSGMVSVYISGGGEEASLFVRSLKLFTLAESLGGIESLSEIPSVMTHASVPAELRSQLGIDDSLVRLSVGIEGTQDLLDDLKQALSIVESTFAVEK